MFIEDLSDDTRLLMYMARGINRGDVQIKTTFIHEPSPTKRSYYHVELTDKTDRYPYTDFNMYIIPFMEFVTNALNEEFQYLIK